MSDFISRAAMTVLEYDDPANPEFGVILFGPNLDALVELLTDPKGYILRTQNPPTSDPGFRYASGVDPNKQKPWLLEPPVTVVMQNGRSSDTLRTKAVLYAGLARPEHGVADKSALINQFDAEFACTGAFFAEFSIETSLINITYFPKIDACPGPPTHNPAHWPPQPRFNQTITPLTLVEVQSSVYTQSFIHFDLATLPGNQRLNSRDRAEFVVSYIENREFLQTYLHNTAIGIKRGAASLVDRGSDITPLEPPLINGLRPTFEPRAIGVGLITIEGLSTSDSVEPCVLLNAELDPNGVFVYDELYVKAY